MHTSIRLYSTSARHVARLATESKTRPGLTASPYTPLTIAAIRSKSKSTASSPPSLTRPATDVKAPAALRSNSAPRGVGQRRSFFSLPDISKLAGLNEVQKTETGEVRMEGEQQTFHARKILPYSAAQLYNIVSDIPSYSSFIPFCTSSTVLAPLPVPTASSSSSSSSSPSGRASAGRRRAETNWKPTEEPFDVEAELKVGFGGLEEAYVSKVTGRPFEMVRAEAAEEAALFKSLVTTWSFSPASNLSPHPTTPSTSPPTNPRVPNDTSSLASDTSRGPTLLTINLAFEFSNPLHRIASQAVLPKVADKMVQAFERRCLEVYGRGTA